MSFRKLILGILVIGLIPRIGSIIVGVDTLVTIVPDDAFYYFQIARNILDGKGSTFDGIYPTNGYHPLWMLVLLPIAALIHNPDVLIIDEPMVGLDPAAIKMVKELFVELAKEGKTVFMSTHTLVVAENVCDRLGIIHKGSLIAIGTAEELRQNVDAEDADNEHVFIKLTGH